MDLDIKWTDFAKFELKKVFLYYKNHFSHRTARFVVASVHQDVNRLRAQAEIGPIEELLINREQEFRYLISKHLKIVYWINMEDHWIEIVDIFDTRQDPSKIHTKR
jgi:plasmid stabilization system protein ParE